MVLMGPTPGGRSRLRTTRGNLTYKPQEHTENTDQGSPGLLDASTGSQAGSVAKGHYHNDAMNFERPDVGEDSEDQVVMLDDTSIASVHKIGKHDAMYIYAAGESSSHETVVVNDDLESGCQGNVSNGLVGQGEDVQTGTECKTGRVVKDAGLKDPGDESQTFSYLFDGADHSLFDISLPSGGLPRTVGGARDMVVDAGKNTAGTAVGNRSVGGVRQRIVCIDQLVVGEGRKDVGMVDVDTDSVGPVSGGDRSILLDGEDLRNPGVLGKSVGPGSPDGRPPELARTDLRNSHVLEDSVKPASADWKPIQFIKQDSQYMLKDTVDEIDKITTQNNNNAERNPTSSCDDIVLDLSTVSPDDNGGEDVLQEKSSAPCKIIATMNTNVTEGNESERTKNKNTILRLSSSRTSQDHPNKSHVPSAESLETGQGQDMTLCHDSDLSQEIETRSRKTDDISAKVCSENPSERDVFMPVVIKTEPDSSVPDMPYFEMEVPSRPLSDRGRRKLTEADRDSPLPAKRLKTNSKSHGHQMATESASISYSCKVCEKSFSKETKLNVHLKLHRQNDGLQCGTCNRKFKTVERFKSHECKSSVYFECGICEQVFTERDKLKHHVENHRKLPEVMNFECGICKLTFTEATSLNVHLQTHEERKRFQCKLCEKTFKSSKCLVNHRKKKHGKIYKCNICSKQFGKQTSLDAHAKMHTKRQRFGCKKCQKRFSKLIDLRIHLKTHKRWKCKTCDEIFETSTELVEHKVVHETMYECANCEFTCSSEAVIKTHMISHEETRSFPCAECDKSYKSLKWLQNHCKKSHGKHYKCDVCSEEFEEATSLSNHSLLHTSEDNFKCEACGLRFHNSKELKQHVKVHKKWKCRRCDIEYETKEELKIHRDRHKRPFRCVACDFASKTASELKNHMLSHDDIDEFTCKICDETFSTATALYSHQLTHINLKKYTCEYCGSGFTHRSTLIIHKRVHTGERPYPCTMCDKAFIEKSALRSHMISHSSERKHKCEQCGKTFPHKCSLVRHWRIHNEEKPFQCEQCKKTFGQSTQLKRHKRTHTGEKPFKCEDCGLRFGYIETLRSHRRIHNDITIYCKLCDKSFSTTVHLKRHMKTHTGEVDFVCDMCGEGFIRKDYFMKHFKSHEKKSENAKASKVHS